VKRATLAIALAALLATVLAASFAGRAPVRFADSEGYLWAAAQPLDTKFFASERPPFEFGSRPSPEDGLYRNRPWLVPLLYRACSLLPSRIVWAQLLLYSLGAALGLLLLLDGARCGSETLGASTIVPAALPLAGLALTWYVSGWCGVLLSESTVLALAWLAAGGIASYLARGRRAALALAWCASAALLFARDSAGLLALPLLAAAALAAVASGDRRRARSLAGAGLLLLPLVVSALALASRGHRTVLPIANVLLVRIAPDATALDWWRERGLPWDADLERFRGGFAFAHDLALFREPRYAPFLRFVDERGRGLLLRFLVTHPLWTVRETWRARADLFGTDLDTYVGVPPRALAPVDRVARWIGALGAALVLAAWAVRVVVRRRSPSGADLVPFVIAAAFLCHGLAALHADAAEPERHTFPTTFGLQLAAGYVAARFLSERRVGFRETADVAAA